MPDKNDVEQEGVTSFCIPSSKKFKSRSHGCLSSMAQSEQLVRRKSHYRDDAGHIATEHFHLSQYDGSDTLNIENDMENVDLDWRKKTSEWIANHSIPNQEYRKMQPSTGNTTQKVACGLQRWRLGEVNSSTHSQTDDAQIDLPQKSDTPTRSPDTGTPSRPPGRLHRVSHSYDEILINKRRVPSFCSATLSHDMFSPEDKKTSDKKPLLARIKEKFRLFIPSQKSCSNVFDSMDVPHEGSLDSSFFRAFSSDSGVTMF
jgi:hypothetical protein